MKKDVRGKMISENYNKKKPAQSYQQEDYLEQHETFIEQHDRNNDDPEPDRNQDVQYNAQNNHNPPMNDDQEVPNIECQPTGTAVCICCNQNNATADLNTCFECREMIHQHGIQALEHIRHRAQEFDDNIEMDDAENGEEHDVGYDEAGDDDEHDVVNDDTGDGDEEEEDDDDDDILGQEPEPDHNDGYDGGEDDDEDDPRGGDPDGGADWMNKLNEAEQEWVKYFKGRYFESLNFFEWSFLW